MLKPPEIPQIPQIRTIPVNTYNFRNLLCPVNTSKHRENDNKRKIVTFLLA